LTTAPRSGKQPDQGGRDPVSEARGEARSDIENDVDARLVPCRDGTAFQRGTELVLSMTCVAERKSHFIFIPYQIDLRGSSTHLKYFKRPEMDKKETLENREALGGCLVSGGGTESPPCGRFSKRRTQD
jgi:hypothetical protein